MALKVTKVDVWAAEIQDTPGGLARVLGPIADAGGSVQCVIARRNADRPGSGVVFFTPVKGKKVEAAARNVGGNPATNMVTIRVEGADKSGLGARMMQMIADAGVNVRGVSTAVIGKNFATYIGFDNADDAAKAGKAVKERGSQGAGEGKVKALKHLKA